MKKLIGYIIIIFAIETLFSLCIFIDKRDLEQFGFWNQWLLLHIPLAIFFIFVVVVIFGISIIAKSK